MTVIPLWRWCSLSRSPSFFMDSINIYLLAGAQFTFLNPKFQVLTLTYLQNLPPLTALSVLELSPHLASQAQSSKNLLLSGLPSPSLTLPIGSLQRLLFLLQHVKWHNAPQICPHTSSHHQWHRPLTWVQLLLNVVVLDYTCLVRSRSVLLQCVSQTQCM